MTGLEFAKLLGELPEEYVQQAQVYRTGSRRAMPSGSKGKRALGILAAAVLAIAMLGGFYWALNHLAQREAVEQSPVNTWQDSILRGEEAFWSETYQKNLTLEEVKIFNATELRILKLMTLLLNRLKQGK